MNHTAIKMRKQLQKYTKAFSEKRFWRIIKRFAKKTGLSACYSALLMYYAYKREETPYFARHIILGSMGYLISPIDAIPDLTPVLGYTDDIGILSFGLVSIAAYINNDIRITARKKLKKWFGDYDLSLLQTVDEKL